VGKNLVSVLQLNAEHRIGQGFDYASLDLDGAVFLCHTFLAILALVSYSLAPFQHSLRSD
jgi:hypothetical protein